MAFSFGRSPTGAKYSRRHDRKYLSLSYYSIMLSNASFYYESWRVITSPKIMKFRWNSMLFTFEWSFVIYYTCRSDPPFIVSPCFYTSPAGYRMRVRLFPNGDRDQRGRGLSLYMMIMRGPYDKMLRWPFDKQVIVSVVDQSDYPPVVQPSPGSPPQMPTERADYVCAIRPDLTKQSQIDACKMPRPDRESNPAIGFVRFIEHGDLTQPHMRTINQQPLLPASDRSQSTPQGVQVTPLYIKDNTIFIRVIVEPLDRAAMAERWTAF